jgi:predicted ribosome quality control (RQC) complex YloA/Tae2 family protein
LSGSNKDIDNQSLLKYLNKSLSNAEAHEFERSASDDEFLNDAIEGLQKIDSPNKVDAITEQLNIELQKKLQKKKLRREKRKWKDQPWIYFAIVLILILVVLCYYFVRVYQLKP